MRLDYLAILGSSFKSKFSKKKNIGLNTCLNCKHHQEEAFHYCPNCGQKARDSRITLKSIFGEIFSSIFNFDASLYKSFLWLPIPAYLSKRYVKGERKQYLNPIRFFFFAMLLFFALLTTTLDMDNIDSHMKNQLSIIEKSELLEKFQNEINGDEYSSIDNAQKDSLRESLFKGVLLPENDSIMNFNFKEDSIIFNLLTPLNLIRRDLYHTPIPEVLDNLGDRNWIDKMFVQQFLRVNRNPKAATSFFLGNGIWVIIATILFVSFVMKFFYIRRKRYLIEHAVILFHTHAFGFIIGSIGVVLSYFVAEKDPLIFGTFSIAILYSIISLKIYYGQGWLKTLIKFVLISFFYLIAMTILILVVLLFSLFLFN